MTEKKFELYGYRFVTLGVYMIINAIVQTLWITFAPITGSAAEFYHVTDLEIGLLSLVWMIVYLVVSIPASWIIDTRGARVGVSIGAILTAVFGLMRGYFGADYGMVMIATIGIAVGQPFVMNATTTIAAKWFGITQRATAGGFVALATFIGIIIGMALTPPLFLAYGMVTTLIIYGWVSVVCAVIYIVFAREAPATPPCPPGHEERALVLDGFKSVWKVKQFNLIMVVMFIGFGMFNGITTWIEPIIRPRGFDITQAGTLGAVILFAGIFGAIIWPVLSDKLRIRGKILMWAILLGVPGLIGLIYATSFIVLLLSGIVLGFFSMSVGPIVFQFGAEVTRPTPEGTSNGLLIMVGQLSGIIFIFGMDMFKDAKTGSMTTILLVLLIFKLCNVFLASRLKDSDLIQEEAGS
ncbi:MAG: MFS transporter [Deltaproteobacteria bacterium]|jgi:MFS family permease|nr:MFS transporter [Deltaproteobacteria bacterium]MBT4269560.1 MFS transporter [Deltaproteobacteria bacterium]MBT4642111.1 MFS transporter [Deltaproteobacteria bacterium]MBT6612574.1 MFS transporter [Deltaproteobacteria bacterium]MBT7711940.1 MFS transporter [Deltaproteobacteria bacterium]